MTPQIGSAAGWGPTLAATAGLVPAPSPTPLFAAPRIGCAPRSDGGWRIWSWAPLPDHPPRLTDHLFLWGKAVPDRAFLRQRRPEGGWRTVTYGEAAEAARRIGHALLALGLGPERPVVVLSGNTVEHALLMLAAQAAGVPCSSVSAAYSLLDPSMGKLRHILAQLTPGLIHVDVASHFTAALSLSEATAAPVYATEPSGVGRAHPFAALLDRAVQRNVPAADPDAPAKILFTSGSTGTPKGVITTHRMLATNQEQIAEVWPFLRREPPILLDWLPWSHVFGNNHDLGMVLRHGGTLWIDDGRPMPGEFDRSLANLREVSPTISLNVPKAYELLVPQLEADDTLAHAFFARLRLILSAAAALPAPLWQRLQALAMTHGSNGPVPIVSAWGMTETAPTVTAVHVAAAATHSIGNPVPGVQLHLTPDGDKFEARVCGPNVTPGYWRDPAATAAAFDAEGLFRTGDALRWIDPQRPELGLAFDGRLTDDFKLSTGTRVNAGDVRIRALSALNAVARDLVVVGENRNAIGLLLVPHDARRVELGSPGLAAEVKMLLRRLNAAAPSSRTIAHVLILREPPSLSAGEITDKGSLNGRAILRNRPDALARMYAETVPAHHPSFAVF